MSEEKRSSSNVLAQATILMVAGIITRIIGVLYRSPVTSIIGDEGNGYYGIAVNIYTMVLLISSYSIPMAVSKVVSGKLALKQYKDAHKVFRCAVIYVFIVGSVASMITFFGASYLIPESQAMAVPVLRVLAPTIFFSGFLGVLRGYFQAHGTMLPTSISQIVEQIANAIVSIGAAILFIRLFAGGDPVKVPVFGAMGSAAGIGAGVVTGLLFMLLLYGVNRSFFLARTRRDVTGQESSYGQIFRIIFFMVTPVILSTFVYNINPVMDQTLFMDIMAFKRMDSKLAAELYGVFSGKYWVLINVPVALANSSSTAMIPAVSTYYTLRDYDRCNRQVHQVVKFTMLISIPCAIGLGTLAYPIMEVLFPQRETIDLAVSLLRTGCISVVFYSLSTVTNGVLQGIGKVNIPLRNAALSLVFHIMVLTPLLYFTDLDLYALVIATMFYAFMMCFLNNVSVRKYLHYRQEFKKTFFIPFLSAAVMGLACYGFYQGLDLVFRRYLMHYISYRLLSLLGLGASIVVGVLVYFAFVLRLRGVSRQELKQFPMGTRLVSLGNKFKLFPVESQEQETK